MPASIVTLVTLDSFRIWSHTSGMNVYALSTIVAVVLYIPLFITLVINRSWQKPQKLLVFYLITASIWSLSTFFLRSTFFLDDKLFLFRVVNCSFMLMIVQLYYFIRFIIYRSGGPGIWFGYSTLGIYAALTFLGYISPGFTLSGGAVTPVFGWWLASMATPPFILGASLVYSLGLLTIVLVDARERNLNIYLLLAVGILMLFNLSAITPYGAQLPFSHFGNVLAAFILTYVIVRHRLVDIRVTLRKTVVWSSLIITGIGAYVLLLFLSHLGFGFEFGKPPLAVGLGGAMGAAAATYLLRGIYFKKVEQLFYGETYDYRQELNRLVRRIHDASGLEELGGKLLPLVGKVLNSGEASLLFPETGNGEFVTRVVNPPRRSGSLAGMRLRVDDPVLEWLKREGETLSKDRLEILPELRGLWGEERERIEAAEVEIFVPLISRGELVGVLTLGRKRSGNYTLADIDLIESIARQVSRSMEKEYLYEQLQQQERELALINRLTKIITSSLNIQEVYKGFAQALKEAVEVDWATISLIDGDELYFMAFSSEIGQAWQSGQRIPLEGTAAQWVSTWKEPLVEPDLTQERKFWTGEYHVKQGIRSIVYLPLIVRDRVIGCLNIASRSPHAYSRQQVRFLEQLVLQIATPIENARLYAAAEERALVDELTGLFNRRHLEERLEEEIGRGLRYAATFSLIILDLDHFKMFNDTYGHLAGDELLKQIGRFIGGTIRDSDQAFRYGGDEFAVILPQTTVDDAYKVAERVREKIATEMRERKILLAASLGLAGWPTDGVSSTEIINAADIALYYAKQTGGNQSYRPSQALPSLVGPEGKSQIELEGESLSTVYALALAVDARDHYTYGHSRRVSEYAVALAKALGLSSVEVNRLSITALLHDVGKIGISDKILNKPSTLTAAEWEAIKSHPQLGANIVSNIPSLVACLPGILCHHERYDGNGYPKALKGEAIPLEARILCIADAFAAMTSVRPYREAISYGEAMEELRRCAGTMFDPEMVDAFCGVIEPVLSKESKTTK